ncbi:MULTISPECIES: hypothetical protein [unclassified Bradyrhizobium]|uniref:hypothetical protein n=1 Tax=unclassified Bradyrhizobium TaxID=2631580 RepID=UPI001FF767D6|nr:MULTISPECIES: hypothetical protein [unclassified Bradyrhizobium]MCK1707653.1 hypothetical protein [Bradyrhizobium sp. 143]MCK1731726.1 hypothetical protein [Bradyrhizobium sp. 142]
MRKEAAAEKEARRSACLRYPPRAHNDVEHSSVSGRDAAFLIPLRMDPDIALFIAHSGDANPDRFVFGAVGPPLNCTYSA